MKGFFKKGQPHLRRGRRGHGGLDRGRHDSHAGSHVAPDPAYPDWHGRESKWNCDSFTYRDERSMYNFFVHIHILTYEKSSYHVTKPKFHRKLFKFFFVVPGARPSAYTIPHGPFRGGGPLTLIPSVLFLRVQGVNKSASIFSPQRCMILIIMSEKRYTLSVFLKKYLLNWEKFRHLPKLEQLKCTYRHLTMHFWHTYSSPISRYWPAPLLTSRPLGQRRRASPAWGIWRRWRGWGRTCSCTSAQTRSIRWEKKTEFEFI